MSETTVAENTIESPKRYHPALVTLHWLVVLLVFTNLIIGLFVFEPALRGGGAFRIPESLIAIHIAVGITILVLLIVRFIVRLRSRKPAPATAGSQSLNVVARLVHYALYLVVFALTAVGLIFARQTNRLQRAFFGGGPRFAGSGAAISEASRPRTQVRLSRPSATAAITCRALAISPAVVRDSRAMASGREVRVDVLDLLSFCYPSTWILPSSSPS